MPVTPDKVAMTYAEWEAEGERRFGSDRMTWRFVCPACGHIASTQDWKDARAKEETVGFSCVGRYQKGIQPRDAFADGPGPCNYAGGGLIGLNPIRLSFENTPRTMDVFAFANAGEAPNA